MNTELYAEAMLGKDAEEFLETDIGRYLIGRAEQESREAMDQLKKIYPWRRRKIQELQNRIWLAENVQGWIVELIISGRQALQTLDEQSKDD
jgi:hypothetical protein